MNPVKFPEANITLVAPEGMDNCSPLRVHTNGRICTAVWELDEAEVEMLVRSRRIAIGIYSGLTLPPYHMQVLDQGQSPYLEPCRAFNLKEPMEIDEEYLAAILGTADEIKCQHCGVMRALHSKITMQCPKVLVSKGVLGCTITGFFETVYQAKG